MAIPLIGLAIAAIAGGAAGGAAGSMFGSNIDQERQRLEEAVAQYKAETERLTRRYENFTSISDVINDNSLAKVNNGLDSAYLTDLKKAFIAPKQFQFKNEEPQIY